MKYIELITNAFRLRNVIDSSQVPDPEQGASAVMLLNQLMEELRVNGTDLQYIPIPFGQVGNDLTIPKYAEGGITAALAIRIVAGAAITPELQAQHDSGMGTILRKSMTANLQPPSMAHIPAGEAVRRRAGDDFYSG